MSIRLGEWWRWRGTLGRLPYALFGVGLCLLKFPLDLSLAVVAFHRPWRPWSYFAPLGPGAQVDALPADQQAFSSWMLLLAVPFIWLGVTLTVKRLRDAGQPVWLVVLFFVPVVNLFLFLVLCLTGSHPRPVGLEAAPWPATRRLDAWIPRSALGAGVLSIGLTLVLGLAFTVLGTAALRSYGWGLFVALPFCLGLFSVLVYSYHGSRSLGSCLAVSLVPVALLASVLLMLALEGLVCLLMAAPFAIALAALGGTLGYAIQAGYWSARGSPAMLSVVLLFTPSFMGAEFLSRPRPEVFAVRSAIEVDAPPEAVWNGVVSFGEIAPPTELIFRAGIAYPLRAEMRGTGVGAVRRCVFSTGTFVEPIEVWDAPRLLRFGVSQVPPPLREMTPYAGVDPPHLHGYFVSRQGQFRLDPLPGGRTRLEGTTWYSHTLWPAEYWRLWSDYIIHRIHGRVLEHIRTGVEAGRGPPAMGR